jgi:CBS domain-containing protein
MSVAWILKEKGRNVSSVLPATSLNETITVLARNQIGAVVVTDEGRHILGTISERDIVRIIATQGVAALVEPVAEHMAKPVMTCTGHHNIDKVERIQDAVIQALLKLGNLTTEDLGVLAGKETSEEI